MNRGTLYASSEWDQTKNYDLLQQRLKRIASEPSKIDNRLPPQVINYRHVKFINDNADLIEKENRLILERLTLINQRQKARKAAGLDYKKVHQRLNVKYKAELNRRIAHENAALIKRILQTPTTVPRRSDCNKEWKHIQRVRSCRLKFKASAQRFHESKKNRLSQSGSLPPIHGSATQRVQSVDLPEREIEVQNVEDPSTTVASGFLPAPIN